MIFVNICEHYFRTTGSKKETEMIALLSPAVPDSNWTRLYNTLVKKISLESIGIFQTHESFYDRIRQGKTDIPAAVVFASNRRDLIKLQDIRELISDM